MALFCSRLSRTIAASRGGVCSGIGVSRELGSSGRFRDATTGGPGRVWVGPVWVPVLLSKTIDVIRQVYSGFVFYTCFGVYSELCKPTIA